MPLIVMISLLLGVSMGPLVFVWDYATCEYPDVMDSAEKGLFTLLGFVFWPFTIAGILIYIFAEIIRAIVQNRRNKKLQEIGD